MYIGYLLNHICWGGDSLKSNSTYVFNKVLREVLNNFSYTRCAINIKVVLQKQLPFWEHLSVSERNLLVSQSRIIRYKKGDTIRGPGKEPGLILVQSGMLRSYLLSEEGKVVTIYEPRPGFVCAFSAMHIIEPINFDLYIDASEDSDVFTIPIDVFDKVAQKNLHAKNFLYFVVAKCMSKIIATMEKMLFLSIDRRLFYFIEEELARSGSSKIAITHEQIANSIGSAREVVTRALKRIADKGKIELFRGGIRVLDEELLRGLKGTDVQAE